jgi:replicative DNA helicase Mcm
LLVTEGSAPDPAKNSIVGIQKSQEGDEILARDLIRKYIAYSKRSIHPKLEEDAQNKIVEFYVDTRKKGGESSDSVSITARSLEAVARMAEASARIRLSNVSTVDDVERAIRLTKTWRNELMGENFDMTTIETGKKTSVRNQERMLIEIISTLQNQSTNQVKVASVLDVYTEAEKYKISRTKAEDIIEKLVRNGDIMRPSGYDTLQIV